MDRPIRSLALRCPRWPLVATGHALDALAAVVVVNRIVAVTPAAQAQGVTVGLRRRAAQSRCPDLVLVERDIAAEARRFDAVVVALDAIVPRVEITRPGACVFATRGPSRYFGGDAAVAERVTTTVADALAGAGPVRVGVADGAFAATVAAGQAPDDGHLVVEPGRSRQFLAPFGVATLERPDLAGVLVRLGVTTLGAVAELTMADVVGRFGVEGRRAHRLASGLDERPPAPAAPPDDLAVSIEIDPPAERVDQIAFVAKAAADDLLERLARRASVCTRILVGAETDHGERRERLWRHEGALSSTAVAERVRWQLDGWLNGAPAARPTGPVTRLYLHPDEVVAATGRQLGFWGGRRAGDELAARAVARVQGLVGDRSVTMATPAGGRQPHDQLVLMPVEEADLLDGRDHRAGDGSASSSPWPGRLPPPSPMVVYHQPLLAQVVDNDRIPVTVSARGAVSAPLRWLGLGDDPREWFDIVGWAGPWPLEERWWDADGARRRARFQVVTNDGRARLLGLEGRRWWIDASYE